MGKRIGAYLFAMLGTAVAANAGPAPCSLSNLTRCADTNRLVWSAGFDRAVRAFVGDQRRDYLGRSMKLADIVEQVLGGPPQTPQRLADGSWLFAACRAHSCEEKGAMIVSGRGRIRAAAIIHYACGQHWYDDSGVHDCRKAPMLTVLLARRGGEPAPVSALLAWGRAQDDYDPIARSTAKLKLNDVEIVYTKQAD